MGAQQRLTEHSWAALKQIGEIIRDTSEWPGTAWAPRVVHRPHDEGLYIFDTTGSGRRSGIEAAFLAVKEGEVAG